MKPVVKTNLSVPMVTASTLTLSVTMKTTVWMEVMKSAAVSMSFVVSMQTLYVTFLCSLCSRSM